MSRSRKSEFGALSTRDVVDAVQSLRKSYDHRGIRIPTDLPRKHAALADRAMSRIVDVMEEQVSHLQAPNVLRAAIEVRSEILGERIKKVQVDATFEAIVRASLPEEPSSPIIDVSPSIPVLPEASVSELPESGSLVAALGTQDSGSQDGAKKKATPPTRRRGPRTTSD